MRVVVIFPGALGDLCLLASALARLRARDAVLTVSVQRQLAAIVPVLVPDARLGPPVDGAAMATLFADAPTPELRAWLAGADRVDAWVARSDVADRVRARLAAASGGVVRLHAVPRADGDRHVEEEYLAALDVATVPAVSIAVPSADGRAWRGRTDARLLIHPGAGSPAKRWSAEGFRRVADASAAAGGEVNVLLGPADTDDTAYWRASGHRVLGELALDAVAALLAGASRYVGNDSGVSHLAGALGRRGVVLFGPTRPERWRPIGGALHAVRFAGRAVADVAREVHAALAAIPASYLDTPHRRH